LVCSKEKCGPWHVVLIKIIGKDTMESISGCFTLRRYRENRIASQPFSRIWKAGQLSLGLNELCLKNRQKASGGDQLNTERNGYMTKFPLWFSNNRHE